MIYIIDLIVVYIIAIGGALGSLSSFAQSISGVILHGAATAHMTSAQNGLSKDRQRYNWIDRNINRYID